MLIVISPAKTLDFDTPTTARPASKPAMLKEAAQLVDTLRGYAPRDLVDLMGISDKLGELNAERYLSWQTPFTKKNAKQAVLAFKGDVYTGLEADRFSTADLTWAQAHLRILSGLYGLLRPLDLMQPYRLEMGTKLATAQGNSLYEFWGDKLSKAVNRQLTTLGSDVVVNLASNEYFKAINNDALKARIITPIFKDLKNGKYKIISFYAKKARGSMTAYIIRNQLQEASQLENFDVDGYRFSPQDSTLEQLVFLRDNPE